MSMQKELGINIMVGITTCGECHRNQNIGTNGVTNGNILILVEGHRVHMSHYGAVQFRRQLEDGAEFSGTPDRAYFLTPRKKPGPDYPGPVTFADQIMELYPICKVTKYGDPQPHAGERAGWVVMRKGRELEHHFTF